MDRSAADGEGGAAVRPAAFLALACRFREEGKSRWMCRWLRFDAVSEAVVPEAVAAAKACADASLGSVFHGTRIAGASEAMEAFPDADVRVVVCGGGDRTAFGESDAKTARRALGALSANFAALSSWGAGPSGSGEGSGLGIDEAARAAWRSMEASLIGSDSDPGSAAPPRRRL